MTTVALKPFTVKQAMARLRCSRVTLYRWMKLGTVATSKVKGQRTVWLPWLIEGEDRR